MHPDAETDTRSPWYEAFSPPSQPPLTGVHWIGATNGDGPAAGAYQEPADTEQPNDALFDCYNG